MSAEFPFVDPAKMRTKESGEMAGSLNRSLAEGQERVHRLFRVLHEWILFSRETQLGLVEAAICWVTAAIARNIRRNECQSNFYCFVDSMYASTQEAMSTLDQRKREQIAMAAAAMQRQISPAIPEILSASAKQIDSAVANSLSLNVVTELHAMRRSYIEHVPEPALRDLITKCFVLCQAIDSELVGAETAEDVEKKLVGLTKASLAILGEVHNALEEGRLVVVNGVVLNPSIDDDTEHDELDDDDDA